ncbi:MAG: iron-containing alcohol dehydrogenase [Marinobacter sp.]|nr:iron-containing alcohol dehydrogenase [Marinobacter sp.]
MSDMRTLIRSKAQLAALKLAVTVIPAPKPNVLMGKGSGLRLCDMMAHFGIQRPLLVTDDVLLKLGVLDPLLARLEKLGMSPSVFSGVKPDPTFAVVDAGLTALAAAQSDAVLAVGGGSSIDAAKVIALSASNQKPPRKLVGVLKARKPSLPLFVIPTTAGTGSEVTLGAVISDEQSHQKALVIDPKLVPLATALDSGIMAGMPPSVTADTGIDALTHALEAWVSDFANPQTDFYAGAAVRMVLENLEKACSGKSTLAAREAMALAAHYGGLALNQAGLGYVHGIAHQLGAFYGVPHGRANAIVLPHVLGFNRKVSGPRLAELARRVGLADAGTDEQLAADRLISRVRELIRNVGISPYVPALREADFPEIIRGAFAETHGTYAVPKYMQKQDVEGILRALMPV